MSYFIFGDPKLTEEDGTYTIHNIRTKLILLDIKRAMSTSRIGKHLFSSITSTRLTFHKFFAFELHTALKRIVDDRFLRSNIRAISIVVEALETQTWLANLNDEKGNSGRLEFRELRQMSLTPLDHQMKFFKRYDWLLNAMGTSGVLLGAAAGTGKTYMGLALSAMLKSDYTIVVAPKSTIIDVWEASIKSLYRKPPETFYSVYDKPYDGEEFSVWHYESLGKLNELERTFKGKSVTIILDESHKLNTADSKRSELFSAFCKAVNAKDVIWMSGTPIKALGVEAIPLISTIDPSFTRPVETRYRKMVSGKTWGGTELVAERLELVVTKIGKEVIDVNPPTFITLPVRIPNGKEYTLDVIREKVRTFVTDKVTYYREALPTYTETWKTLTEKAMELNPSVSQKEWEEYFSRVHYIQKLEKQGKLRDSGEFLKTVNRFEREAILPYLKGRDKADFRDAKSVVKYISLKVLGEALGQVIGGLRKEAVETIAKQAPYQMLFESTSMKFVVFSYYVDAVTIAGEKCKELGLTPAVLTGQNSKELSPLVTKFMTDGETNPMIATFDMLSTGVPLTSADTMLLLNPPYRDYELQQAVSRISRINGAKDTYVYTAVLDTGEESNITTRNLEILSWSQTQVEQLLKIESPFKIDPLSGEELETESSFDQVRELLPLFPGFKSVITYIRPKWL